MSYRNSEEVQAQKLWDPLEQAISKIYKRQQIDLSYMELYNKAYNLTLQNSGKFAYERLKEALQYHFSQDAHKVISEKDPNTFLVNFYRVWNEIAEFVKSIANVFDYMHSKFIPRHRLSPLKGLSNQVFREVFFDDAQFCNNIQRIILDMFYNERKGNMVDKMLLHNIIRILVLLPTNF